MTFSNLPASLIVSSVYSQLRMDWLPPAMLRHVPLSMLSAPLALAAT